MYNRLNASEMRIPSQVADGIFAAPSVYQDIVVWQDERNSDPNNFRPDIYMYNLTSNQETRITTDKAFAYNPVIYGDTILWEDQRNGNNTDIYMYDLKTKKETKLIAGKEDEFSPQIYGDIITYLSGRDTTNLYMYNLKTKKTTKITKKPTVLGSSDIYGNIIAWDDNRKGKPGIYIYNITNNKETRISGRNNTYLYGIWGNTVIWNTITTEKTEYNVVDMYSHNILKNETKRIVKGIVGAMR
jgi:beta propeller repeat protein